MKKALIFSFVLVAFATVTNAQEVMTNDAVVKMVKAGLDESLILEMIGSHHGNYSLTSDSLVKLKQQGVPGRVLSAMMAKKRSDDSSAASAKGLPSATGRNLKGKWEVRNRRDSMTGALSVEAFMKTDAVRDGQFEVTATCEISKGEVIFWIAYFPTTRNVVLLRQQDNPQVTVDSVNPYGPSIGQIGTPPPFAPIRIKIDDGEVRTLRAYFINNMATLVFFPGDATRAVTDMPAVMGPIISGMAPVFNRIIAMQSPGTPEDAFRADLIRIELPLSNGNSLIIEIRPQDPAFIKFHAGCVEAGLPAGAPGHSISDTYARTLEIMNQNASKGIPDGAYSGGFFAFPVCYSIAASTRCERTGETVRVPGDLAVPLDWNNITRQYCDAHQSGVEVTLKKPERDDGRKRLMMCFDAFRLRMVRDSLVEAGAKDTLPGQNAAQAGSAAIPTRRAGDGLVFDSASSRASRQPQLVRIDADVASANLLTKVEPEYPPAARQGWGVPGSVEFTVTIGSDGRVQALQLVRGHPILVDAARRAVLQWVYRPTLLDGKAVAVTTNVIVPFNLTQ